MDAFILLCSDRSCEWVYCSKIPQATAKRHCSKQSRLFKVTKKLRVSPGQDLGSNRDVGQKINLHHSVHRNLSVSADSFSRRLMLPFLPVVEKPCPTVTTKLQIGWGSGKSSNFVTVQCLCFIKKEHPRLHGLATLERIKTNFQPIKCSKTY